MKKSQKKMILEGGLSIVLLLALFLWYALGILPKQKKSDGEKIFLLGHTNSADLSSIVLDVRQGDYREKTVLSNTAEGWQMIEPIRDRLDAGMLERLLESLNQLESERLFTNVTEKQLKDYGFDNPTGRFVFYFKNGKKHSIVNGQMAMTENYYYTIKDDVSNRVYLIYAYRFSALERMSGELRDRTLWTLPFERLNFISMSFPSGLRIRAEKENNRWKLKEPIQAWADDFAFKKRMLNFFTLRILNFPPQLKQSDQKVLQKNKMAELIFATDSETNQLLISRIRVSNQVLCMSDNRKGLFTLDYQDLTNLFDFKPRDLISNR